MRGLLVFPLCALLLQACSSWPEHGQGGMAERRPPRTMLQADAESSVEVAERFRQLGCATWRLEELRHNGADDYTPGLVWLAERGAARAARSLSARLYHDADVDLIELHARLDAIERQILDRGAPAWSVALRPQDCAS